VPRTVVELAVTDHPFGAASSRGILEGRSGLGTGPVVDHPHNQMAIVPPNVKDARPKTGVLTAPAQVIKRAIHGP